ncbi:hypothetical protein ACTA71_001407 [Dictyostelium dimigraforme]
MDKIENQGFYGTPTASIDWCELNYIYSPYIAEFYNTFSSLIISAFGIYGIWIMMPNINTGVEKEHIKILKELDVRNKVILSYISLIVVGVGSAFYHATLLYQNQLFDELPMIYTALIMLYIMVTVGEEKTKKGFKGGVLGNSLLRHLLPYLLIAYGLFVTITILVIQDQPKILQVSFGALVFYVVFHSIYLINKKKPDGIPSNPDSYLYKYAFVSMLVGFTCWVVERYFCRNGKTFGFQLHAFWHFFTGMSTYVWTQFLICKLLEAKHYCVGIKHTLGLPRIHAIKRF